MQWNASREKERTVHPVLPGFVATHFCSAEGSAGQEGRAPHPADGVHEDVLRTLERLDHSTNIEHAIHAIRSECQHNSSWQQYCLTLPAC